MKKLLVLVGFLAVLLTACGSPGVATPTADITQTVAYQLALIDAQGAPPATSTVAKYQKVLDSLHDKTGDSEAGIANGTVEGQKILRQDGYTGDDRLYTLMQACDQVLTKQEHQKYATTLAELITLMETPS